MAMITLSLDERVASLFQGQPSSSQPSSTQAHLSMPAVSETIAETAAEMPVTYSTLNWFDKLLFRAIRWAEKAGGIPQSPSVIDSSSLNAAITAGRTAVPLASEVGPQFDAGWYQPRLVQFAAADTLDVIEAVRDAAAAPEPSAAGYALRHAALAVPALVAVGAAVAALFGGSGAAHAQSAPVGADAQAGHIGAVALAGIDTVGIIPYAAHGAVPQGWSITDEDLAQKILAYDAQLKAFTVPITGRAVQYKGIEPIGGVPHFRFKLDPPDDATAQDSPRSDNYTFYNFAQDFSVTPEFMKQVIIGYWENEFGLTHGKVVPRDIATDSLSNGAIDFSYVGGENEVFEKTHSGMRIPLLNRNGAAGGREQYAIPWSPVNGKDMIYVPAELFVDNVPETVFGRAAAEVNQVAAREEQEAGNKGYGISRGNLTLASVRNSNPATTMDEYYPANQIFTITHFVPADQALVGRVASSSNVEISIGGKGQDEAITPIPLNPDDPSFQPLRVVYTYNGSVPLRRGDEGLSELVTYYQVRFVQAEERAQDDLAINASAGTTAATEATTPAAFDDTLDFWVAEMGGGFTQITNAQRSGPDANVRTDEGELPSYTYTLPIGSGHNLFIGVGEKNGNTYMLRVAQTRTVETGRKIGAKFEQRTEQLDDSNPGPHDFSGGPFQISRPDMRYVATASTDDNYRNFIINITEGSIPGAQESLPFPLPFPQEESDSGGLATAISDKVDLHVNPGPQMRNPAWPELVKPNGAYPVNAAVSIGYEYLTDDLQKLLDAKLPVSLDQYEREVTVSVTADPLVENAPGWLLATATYTGSGKDLERLISPDDTVNPTNELGSGDKHMVGGSLALLYRITEKGDKDDAGLVRLLLGGQFQVGGSGTATQNLSGGVPTLDQPDVPDHYVKTIADDSSKAVYTARLLVQRNPAETSVYFTDLDIYLTVSDASLSRNLTLSPVSADGTVGRPDVSTTAVLSNGTTNLGLTIQVVAASYLAVKAGAEILNNDITSSNLGNAVTGEYLTLRLPLRLRITDPLLTQENLSLEAGAMIPTYDVGRTTFSAGACYGGTPSFNDRICLDATTTTSLPGMPNENGVNITLRYEDN